MILVRGTMKKETCVGARTSGIQGSLVRSKVMDLSQFTEIQRGEVESAL